MVRPNNQRKFDTTIGIEELPIIVRYEFDVGDPGRTYGPPDTRYRAEPPTAVIVQVLAYGQNIRDILSPRILKQLEKESLAELEEFAELLQDTKELL